MIEGGEKIDSLDRVVLAMVKMPADDVVFISIRLFGNAIVHNQYAIILIEPHEHAT